jgi:Zn-dependent protease with chaperone function
MGAASADWAYLPIAAVALAGVGLAVAVRFSRSVTILRVAVAVVAGWSIVATTALLWAIDVGGFPALGLLARSPTAFLAPANGRLWLWGAIGAFVVFALAFLLSQLVGRGLLRLLRPRPLPWPAGVPRPATPTRLLAFASEKADALMFTLLQPRRGWSWDRVDLILVSEGLLAALTPKEWEAVVAHELGHGRELDGRYLTFLRTFSRMMRWDPVVAVVADSLTRHEELQADQDAVEVTRRPRALARAIYKATVLGAGRRVGVASLLGTGGRRGRARALERIHRLVALAESGRYPEEPGA